MTINELFDQSPLTIAVVGISTDTDRSSYSVSKRMQHYGHSIIPVNPTIIEWEGVKAFNSVSQISEDEQIDIVDIFRRPEFLLEVINDVLSRKNLPKCVWLQQGLYCEEGKKLCEEKGILFIEDECLGVEYGFYKSGMLH